MPRFGAFPEVSKPELTDRLILKTSNPNFNPLEVEGPGNRPTRTVQISYDNFVKDLMVQLGEQATEITEAKRMAGNAMRMARETQKMEGPVGPKGDPGQKGDTGNTGEPGAPGLRGPKGDKGDQGDKGDEGQRGADGARGERGDPGTPGSDGRPGMDGAPGDAGPPGDRGDPGPQGDPGKVGAKGDKGDPGTPGTKGEKGDKGDKGDQGAPGTPGAKGDQGVKGDQGPKGDSGISEIMNATTGANGLVDITFAKTYTTAPRCFAFIRSSDGSMIQQAQVVSVTTSKATVSARTTQKLLVLNVFPDVAMANAAVTLVVYP